MERVDELKVIELLTEKNSYLQKFYLINENELMNFADGNFENVEAFYSARDKILELIRCIDGLVDESNVQDLTMTTVTAAGRAEVESLLKAKDEMVTSILGQDLQILEYVEKEKSSIIRELSSNRQVRRAVGAYATSERMKQLDEKP